MSNLNERRIFALVNAIEYGEATVSLLEQAKTAPFLSRYSLLFAAIGTYLTHLLWVQAAQDQPVVHISCALTIPAKARSHPSLLGRVLATFEAGTVFTNYEERGDNPSVIDPGTWVRVTEYGGYNGDTLWIRRTDGTNDILVDGQPPPCSPQPIVASTPTPASPPAFTYSTPGCTRGQTCLTGSESAAYQVAFILACESAALNFTNFSIRWQVMVDIAHVIRSRMRAEGFPDTALDVVRQSGAFQCYAEGYGTNIETLVEEARPLAEALIANQPLPAPSFPELLSALYFFGTIRPGRGGQAPNTIPADPNVADYFTVVGPNNLAISAVSKTVFLGIYIGHGYFSGSTGTDGFATFFFSDDPEFTGYIP